MRRSQRLRVLGEREEIVADREQRAVKNLQVGFGNGTADIFQRVVYQAFQFICDVFARLGKNELILVFLSAVSAASDKSFVGEFRHNA